MRVGVQTVIEKRKLDEKNNTSLTEQNNTLFFSVMCLTFFFKFIFHSLLSETSITTVFAILEPYLLSLSETSDINNSQNGTI